MPVPRLKKRLGQHHLRDGRLCRPLVEFLRPAGERVLEIGPGGGVLTAELLRAGARVVAVELDAQWAFVLRRRTAPGEGRLRIAVADARDLDFGRLPPPTLVAGNLPFNVATRLVEALLPHAAAVPRAAFMVQKEVGERLVARPGESAYGALSVLVAAQASARWLGAVRPGSFQPPPKVAAAFVGLDLHAPPLPERDMPAFRRLVHLAFGQRRKTLRNALAAKLGRGEAAALLEAAGLPARCRAEELALDVFLELFRLTRERTARTAAAAPR
jgi:16S rRNA (adenine1518-N6/adenine1519-N6)-dimethyltransferase